MRTGAPWRDLPEECDGEEIRRTSEVIGRVAVTGVPEIGGEQRQQRLDVGRCLKRPRVVVRPAFANQIEINMEPARSFQKNAPNSCLSISHPHLVAVLMAWKSPEEGTVARGWRQFACTPSG
jgi:hypothetical protein